MIRTISQTESARRDTLISRAADVALDRISSRLFGLSRPANYPRDAWRRTLLALAYQHGTGVLADGLTEIQVDGSQRAPPRSLQGQRGIEASPDGQGHGTDLLRALLLTEGLMGNGDPAVVVRRIAHRGLLIDGLVHGCLEQARQIHLAPECGAVRDGLDADLLTAPKTETHPVAVQAGGQLGDQRAAGALAMPRATMVDSACSEPTWWLTGNGSPSMMARMRAL